MVVIFQCPCGTALTGYRPSEPSRREASCGQHAALVQKHQAGRLHEALPHLPAAAVPGHIGPILLGGSQGFFYMRP